MTYVGGLRSRLVKESVYSLIYDGLDELGWFDTNREHEPVEMIPRPLDWNEEARPNLIALSEEDVDELEMELGSNLSEFYWDFYIDVYAEDGSIGMHLAGDIKDILQGRFTSIISVGPVIPVIDYTQTAATPIELFNVNVEEVSMSKVRRDAPKAFQRNWWVIYFKVVDEYATELDD